MPLLAHGQTRLLLKFSTGRRAVLITGQITGRHALVVSMKRQSPELLKGSRFKDSFEKWLDGRVCANPRAKEEEGHAAVAARNE